MSLYGKIDYDSWKTDEPAETFVCQRCDETFDVDEADETCEGCCLDCALILSEGRTTMASDALIYTIETFDEDDTRTWQLERAYSGIVSAWAEALRMLPGWSVRLEVWHDGRCLRSATLEWVSRYKHNVEQRAKHGYPFATSWTDYEPLPCNYASVEVPQ